MIEQEAPADVSSAMLSKLNKQQRLLLRELERTKRRLREEISARTERTTVASPTDSNPAAWSNKAHGDEWTSKDTLHAAARLTNKKRSQITSAGGGRQDAGGACLKRSRSEAGMSSIERDAEGVERALTAKLYVARPSPATRIDMLPVMASTGKR